MFLGFLTLLLLIIGALVYRGRLETGSSIIWSARYLDGIVVALAYLGLLFLSVVSWGFGVWRTLQLCKFEGVAAKYRILMIGFLFAAPIILLLSRYHLVSLVRLVTDPLFFD